MYVHFGWGFVIKLHTVSKEKVVSKKIICAFIEISKNHRKTPVPDSPF